MTLGKKKKRHFCLMFLSLYKSEMRCVKEGTISNFFPVCVLLELHRERERGDGSHVFFYDILCWNGERARMREETKVMFCCLCVYSYVVRSSPDIIQQAPINWTRRMGRMQEEKLRGGLL